MPDIVIPPELQWVAYLVGELWPQGSESGMFRISECYLAAAEDLEYLIPELHKVTEKTLEVLVGKTADAAEEHFKMLFDGPHAVDKLVDALRALGESAH
jgi:hypothetical protein